MNIVHSYEAKFLKDMASKKYSCNLCTFKSSKFYKPEEEYSGSKLSSVIQFIFGGHQVDFPPTFRICTTCAVGLTEAALVLKRLSQALPNTRNFLNFQFNSGSTYKGWDDDVLTKNLEKPLKEERIEGLSALDISSLKWTFYCKHCEFKSSKVKVYRNHLLSKHKDNDPRVYKCYYCKQTYQRINAIKTHISCVHGNKPRPKRKSRRSTFKTPSLLSSTTVKDQKENDNNTQENDTTGDEKVLPKNLKYSQYPSNCETQFALQSCIDTEHERKYQEIPQSLSENFELCLKNDSELQMPLPILKEDKSDLSEHHTSEIDNAIQNGNISPKKVTEYLGDELVNNEIDNTILNGNISPKKGTEYLGDELVNNEIDNTIQNGNISPKKGTEYLGDELVNNEIDHKIQNINISLEPQQENGREYLGGELANNEIENINQVGNVSEGLKPEKEHKAEHKRRQKRVHNHSSSSELTKSEWIFQCTDCEYETNKKKLFRSHLSYRHGLSDMDIYKCLYCSASYEHYRILWKHMTHEHSVDMDVMNDTSVIHSDSSQDNMNSPAPKKQKPLETPVKSKGTLQKVNVESSHQSELCVVCGKRFSTVEKLCAHMEKHHDDDEIKSCVKCCRQFRSVEKYEAHLLSEECTQTKLTCQFPDCTVRFSKRSKMQQHMREKHPKFKK